jgi:hypothetical protein
MIASSPTRTSLDSLRQQTGRKPNRGKGVPPKQFIHIEVESLTAEPIWVRQGKHVIKTHDRAD